jgi:hypothetical protein
MANIGFGIVLRIRYFGCDDRSALPRKPNVLNIAERAYRRLNSCPPVTRLTAAICCFALSGFFAWVSSSANSALLTARAHATAYGYMLLSEQSSDSGIANFAMLAAVAMLLIGIGCLIASMFRKSAKPG